MIEWIKGLFKPETLYTVTGEYQVVTIAARSDKEAAEFVARHLPFQVNWKLERKQRG